MTFDPTPRPALKRASDATAHPTAPAAPAAAAAPREFSGNTADVMRPAKPEKTTKLKVQVPKSLKASLEAEAKAAGTSLDALIARILRNR